MANRTDACFIRVIGSELVQKYVGEGARMVRELFQMARSKKACLIFFDEVRARPGSPVPLARLYLWRTVAPIHRAVALQLFEHQSMCRPADMPACSLPVFDS